MIINIYCCLPSFLHTTQSLCVRESESTFIFQNKTALLQSSSLVPVPIPVLLWFMMCIQHIGALYGSIFYCIQILLFDINTAIKITYSVLRYTARTKKATSQRYFKSSRFFNSVTDETLSQLQDGASPRILLLRFSTRRAPQCFF